jgi:tetraacyldisaccharide 4'-kinase
VNGLAALLTRTWYAPKPTPLAQLLRPLSWVFGAVTALRRGAYRHGVLRQVRCARPVVVVGNITVGGAGKTPLVIALIEALRERGRRPGIVSRGHGRRERGIRAVHPDDDAAITGDEPLILAATGVPVWVGADRPAAVRALLDAHPDVDVIVADDGLQHYALARDVEIAVIDDARGLGNALLLPAGPLREPPTRLAAVDAVVRLRPDASPSRDRPSPGGFNMTHEARTWRNLLDPGRAFDPETLRDPATIAIAGIANPERFFHTLRVQGFAGRTQAFADHHAYSRGELAFPGERAILMTEKDAVKCRAFADARMWMLPILARVDPSLFDVVVEKLHGSQAARNAGVPGHERAADPRP